MYFVGCWREWHLSNRKLTVKRNVPYIPLKRDIFVPQKKILLGHLQSAVITLICIRIYCHNKLDSQPSHDSVDYYSKHLFNSHLGGSAGRFWSLIAEFTLMSGRQLSVSCSNKGGDWATRFSSPAAQMGYALRVVLQGKNWPQSACPFQRLLNICKTHRSRQIIWPSTEFKCGRPWNVT